MLEDRILSKINKTDTCWLWTAAINANGYARIGVKVDGKWTTKNAHRYIYKLLVGDIPDDMVCDHLCRVKHCVNPAHIEIVTDEENLLRGSKNGPIFNKFKTHCKQGHEYTPENTYIRKTYRKGRRECKKCWQNYYRKRKALTRQA